MPWRVEELVALPEYRLRVRFRDGLEGFVDMSSFILSPDAGVFAGLADPLQFAQAYLEGGVPTWPGDIDIAPDALYATIRQSKDRTCRLGEERTDAAYDNQTPASELS